MRSMTKVGVASYLKSDELDIARPAEAFLMRDLVYGSLDADTVHGVNFSAGFCYVFGSAPSHSQNTKHPNNYWERLLLIIKKSDALFEKVRAMQALQSAQSADLKALTQSILHQSFQS